MKISLRTKMILMCLIFISLPLLGLGGYVYAAAIVLAMLLVYFFITRNIIKPIKELEKLMLAAGEGDLTVKAQIRTKDEIQTLGNYFNKMIEHQANILNHVRNGAEELKSASEDVSASTEEISTSTEEIAGRIQEVAANAEEQNGSILEISKVLVQLSSLIQIAQTKALTAKQNSDDTMSAARQGRRKVQETVDAIANISKVTTETENMLAELNGLSQKVSGIIDMINDISAQTILLALNAAIEAARAGEHGRGFTVVAGEVRQLSEQTKTGADEIAALIQKMLVQINKAVNSMDTSQQAVENGVIVAKETDQSFVSIMSAVEQIANDIQQIVDVTKDEVASSDQIVQLIDSVASITETTTEHTEEVAAAAEEQVSIIENLAARTAQTSNMAETLDEIVERFNIKGEVKI